MVKPKAKRNPNWLIEELASAARDMGEVVAERWYVAEVAKPYDDPGPYGGYVKGWSHRVTPFYDTEEEAKNFIESHEADRGDYLEARKQRLYKRVTLEWH